MPLKTPSDQDVLDKYGKNGVYAKMTTDILQAEPSLNLNSLWNKVQDKYKKEIRKNPATSNQGAITVAFKLFNNRKIICEEQKPAKKLLHHTASSLPKAISKILDGFHYLKNLSKHLNVI